MIFLLLVYILVIVVFLIYSLVAVYHLWRFGYVGDLTKPVIVAYLIIAAAIIMVSVIMILTRNWPSDFSI